jgi:hypothetical protein
MQGDVIFQVSATDVDLIIGHAFLARAAEANLETWDLPPLKNGKYLVLYHFKLRDRPATKPQVEPVGDPFSRFFLRLFHAPTTRVVQVCDDRPPTDTEVRRAPNGGVT